MDAARPFRTRHGRFGRVAVSATEKRHKRLSIHKTVVSNWRQINTVHPLSLCPPRGTFWRHSITLHITRPKLQSIGVSVHIHILIQHFHSSNA